MNLSNIFSNVLLVLLFVSSLTTASKTFSDFATEAKKRNITTKEQALAELKANGISENEARQLARIQGIEFDTYIDNYFDSSSNDTNNPTYAFSNKNSIQANDSTLLSSNFDEVTKAPILEDTLLTSPTYFGYDIFKNNPFGTKEYLVGNIDDGYLIAPGDILRIFVYGDNVYEQEVKVDINGNLSFTDYGICMAAGSTFGQLKIKLSNFLGRYFSGLKSLPQKSFIDVSLTQIRPVKVTILGECQTPGPHLLNGFATVLNAIYASGGVKTSGSLREIKVYRDNNLIKTVDIYDYITKGNLDNDIRLMTNDIIYISPRLSSIQLKGEVKKGAIYELKEQEGLNELMQFSGGLLPSASLSNVLVKRITPQQQREADNIYNRFLTSVDYSNLLLKHENFKLSDGDQVTFSAILNKTINQVKVAGSVNKPGTYPLSKYRSLKSLIVEAAENVKPLTYFGKVDIFKEALDGKKRFITYNLKSILDDKSEITLEESDSVYVYSMNEVQGQQLVSISGFVDESKVVFWRENLTLYDLIFQSTSFEELQYRSQILTSRVDLRRFDINSGLFEITTYSLDDIASIKTTTLQPKDQVIVYSKSVSIDINKTISVFGFVKSPNDYPLTKDMTIEDAILTAGGFDNYASKDIVIVSRENFDSNTGKVSDRYEVKVDMDYLLGKTTTSSTKFTLENNDVVIIRQEEGYEEKNIIIVTGEVYFPGPIVLENKITSLEDVISYCGGLKPGAELKSSYILRDGKILALNLLRSKSENIFQTGDKLIVNPNYGTVETLGAVQNENLFVWKLKTRAKHYIKLSGGKVRKEAAQCYLVQPNKQTYKISMFRNPKVLPNSRIVVNRKIPKPNKGNSRFIDDAARSLSVIVSALTSIIIIQKL